MDINALTLKANSGDLDACFELAMMYKAGQGVLQNDQVYEKYIKMASAKNHPKALLELGFILVASDKIEEGIDKIKLSAKKGYIEANYYCGQIYFGKLYNQPVNYKLGFKYFETYMVEYEPQTIQFLSEFDPRLYAPSEDDLEKIVQLYEKYGLPKGLYQAALYHLELKKPNYTKAIENLLIAHKKQYLLATYQLFLIYYDQSPIYRDFNGKDYAKATTYYVHLINHDFKVTHENDGKASFFMPPKGGYLATSFDYQKYIEDYKAYVFQSVSYDSNFSSNIKDIKIIPEILLESKPLMFYAGVLDVYQEKPKKKKVVPVIQKEIKYQNFEQRPETKTSVMSERAIYGKLNLSTGICVFESYEPETQIMSTLNQKLDVEKAKHKDTLVDSKVELDFAYAFQPSLRLRYQYLDDTYETKLTPRDIQEGLLLEGPIKPEVQKSIDKVMKTMTKPNSNLYLIFTGLLLIALCAVNFLYFERLPQPFEWVMVGASALWVFITYVLGLKATKGIEVRSKTQLIKMNDALDFKKAIQIKKHNQNRKHMPIRLAVVGILISIFFIVDIYLNILNLV